MTLAVVGISTETGGSMPSDGESASSALFSGFAPLFSPAHIAESSRCSSAESFIPVTASCAAPVVAGSGLVPVGPTLFPFLPVSPYFTSTQGAIAPVMMAVDLRSVYSQQSSTAVTVKDERPESANISEEVDTQDLTTRVRDLLQSHGLGQKLFGEAVLELSQGSVSELLAKPKPWSLLSAKGREPFLRMRAWLADPHGIERLRAFQGQALTGRNPLFFLFNLNVINLLCTGLLLSVIIILFRDVTVCLLSSYRRSFIFLSVNFKVFTARCTLVQSAVVQSHVVCPSVCLSVTLVDCDHIGWNISKIISQLVSVGQGEQPEIWAQSDPPPVDFSVGVIRLQIAAEWLQVVQRSQWRD